MHTKKTPADWIFLLCLLFTFGVDLWALWVALRIHPAYGFTGRTLFTERKDLLERLIAPSVAAFFFTTLLNFRIKRLTFSAILLSAAAAFSPLFARLLMQQNDLTLASYQASGLLWTTLPLAALFLLRSLRLTRSDAMQPSKHRTASRVFFGLILLIPLLTWSASLLLACISPVLGLIPLYYGLVPTVLPGLGALLLGLNSGLLSRRTAWFLGSSIFLLPLEQFTVGLSAQLTLTIGNVLLAALLTGSLLSAGWEKHVSAKEPHNPTP